MGTNSDDRNERPRNCDLNAHLAFFVFFTVTNFAQNRRVDRISTFFAHFAVLRDQIYCVGFAVENK